MLIRSRGLGSRPAGSQETRGLVTSSPGIGELRRAAHCWKIASIIGQLTYLLISFISCICTGCASHSRTKKLTLEAYWRDLSKIDHPTILYEHFQNLSYDSAKTQLNPLRTLVESSPNSRRTHLFSRNSGRSLTKTLKKHIYFPRTKGIATDFRVGSRTQEF